MLYFVVRIDVQASEGTQRVFAACDSKDEADEFIRTRLDHLKGEFRVFGGKQLEGE